MSHPKRASTDHPILDVIAERWSPYAYDANRPVEQEKLLSCLEALRWAASSYNEQPWSYFLARREDAAAFAKMHGCLVEGNQAWAKNAAVLMLAVVQRNFKLNGKPNKAAEHDLGLAAGNFVLQATALGMQAHQMIGIVPDKVRAVYGVPEGYDPLTAIALGYPAPVDTIDDPKLQARETSARTRKKLSEFVFAEAWGKAAGV